MPRKPNLTTATLCCTFGGMWLRYWPPSKVRSPACLSKNRLVASSTYCMFSSFVPCNPPVLISTLQPGCVPGTILTGSSKTWTQEQLPGLRLVQNSTPPTSCRPCPPAPRSSLSRRSPGWLAQGSRTPQLLPPSVPNGDHVPWRKSVSGRLTIPGDLATAPTIVSFASRSSSRRGNIRKMNAARSLS